ncbi:hypothetical protein PQD13_gp34 [Gordonia phage Clawz]|uniref:Uncharacterized protein n=1 Tax=Gordonia phage Clawz TaxID=2743910 RepID=A0AAE7F812_9CAUD|nr:hypothetical protein PQD13_gp34 [Gordonia phage Clawz]QKY79946.1 hypothetical protein SEA_CLAWZ_34 [Gordonia phage Clawz]
MGRMWPENNTIAWCEHCQTQTVFDTEDPETPTCTVCAMRLLNQIGDQK